MKLYKVSVEYTTFVLAKDEKEAEMEAVGTDVTHDLCYENTDFVSAQIVKSLDQVPKEWRNSLPFTSYLIKEEKTIEELLS
jgi:hypothetical protein